MTPDGGSTKSLYTRTVAPEEVKPSQGVRLPIALAQKARSSKAVAITRVEDSDDDLPDLEPVEDSDEEFLPPVRSGSDLLNNLERNKSRNDKLSLLERVQGEFPTPSEGVTKAATESANTTDENVVESTSVVTTPVEAFNETVIELGTSSVAEESEAAPKHSDVSIETVKEVETVKEDATSANVNVGFFAKFIEDVTIPDQSIVPSGAIFSKIWKLCNSGSKTWPQGTTLVYVGGWLNNNLNGLNTVVPLAEMGQVVEIALHDLKAPEESGHYMSFWRLSLPDGTRFGDRLWIE